MPGPDRFPVLPAVRVVADPAALDAALASLEMDRADHDPARVTLDPPVAGGSVRDGPAAEVEAAPDRVAPDRAEHSHWQQGRYTVRLAADDLLIVLTDRVGAARAVDDLNALVAPLDPYAIVEPESGFVGAEVDIDRVRHWVAHHADWPLPPGHGLSQGMVAALAVKIVVAGQQALVMAPASFASELADRFDPAAAAVDVGVVVNEGGRW